GGERERELEQRQRVTRGDVESTSRDRVRECHRSAPFPQASHGRIVQRCERDRRRSAERERVALGAEHQSRSRRPTTPYDERERLGGGLVHPLDVVDDDENGRFGGSLGEQLEEGGVD